MDGVTLGNIGTISIDRLDNASRFQTGQGPAVAPYLNIWITDGNGHYAVVANEPSDPVFQPLYNDGYHLTWNDLKDKPAHLHENNDLSWIPGLPANPTFADLAGYIVQAPSETELATGWPGLGTGAPRQLGSNHAYGVNWIFGDTLANYVSGYVVANASVTAPAATETHLTLTDAQANTGGGNVLGISGSYAPGYAGGSFQAAAPSGGKSELYFTSETLFGRSILVGDIKAVRYWTKTGVLHSASPNDWALVVYTKPFSGDVSTPNWYGARFGAEPYFSPTLADSGLGWNLWSADGLQNTLVFYESTQGAPGATFGTYDDPQWTDFINAESLGTTVRRRDQEVLYISLQTGSAWAFGFNGLLDGLEVELQDGSIGTVNFEAVDAEGPIVSGLNVLPGAVPVTSLSQPVTVTAVADDSATGGSIITSASFTVGGSSPQSLAALDGVFDETTENLAGSFSFAALGAISVGVYQVCVTATDAQNNVSEPECALVAVYDPSAGFVTGGGWIFSPPGAWPNDPGAAGKANFGFVSKYTKGKTVPDGNTEFTFTAGDLNFHSTSYRWLIVNANGQNAQFNGDGTINGTGSYGFMIWAYDGGQGKTPSPDTFRIQIVDHNNNDAVVYDNGANAPIGGGNIIVQTAKK